MRRELFSDAIREAVVVALLDHAASGEIDIDWRDDCGVTQQFLAYALILLLFCSDVRDTRGCVANVPVLAW